MKVRFGVMVSGGPAFPNRSELSKFEELIKRDSSNAEAHFWKADCLAELNDLKGSINSYTTSLNINPKYKIAFYNRALTYEKLNDFEKAIVDYHSAIDVDPKNNSELNNKTVFHNLGILYGQLGQLDNAIIAFTKAIEIDGSYSAAYHNRGFAYQLKYEHDKAIEDFDRALNISPDNRDYINSKTRSLNAKNGTTSSSTLLGQRPILKAKPVPQAGHE